MREAGQEDVVTNHLSQVFLSLPAISCEQQKRRATC